MNLHIETGRKTWLIHNNYLTIGSLLWFGPPYKTLLICWNLFNFLLKNKILILSINLIQHDLNNIMLKFEKRLHKKKFHISITYPNWFHIDVKLYRLSLEMHALQAWHVRLTCHVPSTIAPHATVRLSHLLEEPRQWRQLTRQTWRRDPVFCVGWRRTLRPSPLVHAVPWLRSGTNDRE